MKTRHQQSLVVAALVKARSFNRFRSFDRAFTSAATRRHSGFTMIEIAISLAIIAFALIAIIGVLPIGLRVQRDNREETIINQDAVYLMDAIRSGARGLDDLTNYVDRIDVTNNVTKRSFYLADFGVNPQMIVGLLSTPNNFPYTDRVTAYMRAISGNASEKPPQTDASIRDLAFAYRLTAEVIPYVFSTNNPPDHVTRNLQTNLFEVRLTFRWPLFPNRTIGNGKLTFRTLASGFLQPDLVNGQNVFFMQPSTFIPAP
jgi:type II secretory pathway pseudopilin PulG